MAGPSLTNLDNERGFDLAYSHVMKRKQSVFSLYIGLLSMTQFRSVSSPGSRDKHEVLGPLLSTSAESSKTLSVDGQSANTLCGQPRSVCLKTCQVMSVREGSFMPNVNHASYRIPSGTIMLAYHFLLVHQLQKDAVNQESSLKSYFPVSSNSEMMRFV